MCKLVCEQQASYQFIDFVLSNSESALFNCLQLLACWFGALYQTMESPGFWLVRFKFGTFSKVLCLLPGVCWLLAFSQPFQLHTIPPALPGPQPQGSRPKAYCLQSWPCHRCMRAVCEWGKPTAYSLQTIGAVCEAGRLSLYCMYASERPTTECYSLGPATG